MAHDFKALCLKIDPGCTLERPPMPTGGEAYLVRASDGGRLGWSGRSENLAWMRTHWSLTGAPVPKTRNALCDEAWAKEKALIVAVSVRSHDDLEAIEMGFRAGFEAAQKRV